jgi:hypothetical protein
MIQPVESFGEGKNYFNIMNEEGIDKKAFF